MKISLSSISACIALLAAPSSFAVTALFDFQGTGHPTQAGWAAAPLGNGTSGAVSVATTGLGVAVDSRNRAGSAQDAGGGAESAMWNDFIFGLNSFASAPGTGLSIAVTGLTPNTIYPITIWAFDDASNAQADGFDRTADWSGGGGGGTLSFPNGPDPTTLADYNLMFNATTDAAGDLTIDGVVAATNPSSSHNVFINGLEIGDAIPEPSVSLLGLIALGIAALRRRR